jgi:hypothetical protein
MADQTVASLFTQSIARDQIRIAPRITVDHQATADLFALAQETFQDLLAVRLKTLWWWTLGMTWTLVNLRGLQQFMIDMYDHPRQLHRLMGILRDGHDMWGFCESQETVQVSPAMFEEFVFPYQMPVMERFGLNCYGCCEPLDKRWHVVKRFPRLRRVSVSPWADVEKMAEYLGANYLYSYKPSPSIGGGTIPWRRRTTRASSGQTGRPGLIPVCTPRDDSPTGRAERMTASTGETDSFLATISTAVKNRSPLRDCAMLRMARAAQDGVPKTRTR